MNITFRQVDAFRTVISSGSVSGAAEMLGILQPAVSWLISDLEAEVGFQPRPRKFWRLPVTGLRRATSALLPCRAFPAAQRRATG